MFNAPMILFYFVLRKVTGRAANALRPFLAGTDSSEVHVQSLQKHQDTAVRRHREPFPMHRKTLTPDNSQLKITASTLSESIFPFIFLEGPICIQVF